MGSLKDQIYQYLGALVHHQAHRVSETIAGTPHVPACIDHIDLSLHLASRFEMYLLVFCRHLLFVEAEAKRGLFLVTSTISA